MATVVRRLRARLKDGRLLWGGWTFEVVEWESFLADDGTAQTRPLWLSCLPPGCTFASLALKLPVESWREFIATAKQLVGDRQRVVAHLLAKAKERLSFEELGEVVAALRRLGIT